MIVERKQNRQLLFAMALNTIPDFLIAGIVAIAFDGGMLLFLAVLLGLNVTYFLIWLKNTIWVWFCYMARDKKRAKRHIDDFLTANEFPHPGLRVHNAESYLNDIASDDSIDIKKRLLAAAELGAMSYLQNSMRFREYFQLTMSYDEALEEFGRRIGNDQR